MKIYYAVCIYMLLVILVTNVAWYLHCNKLNKKWYETCKAITNKFDEFIKNLIEEKK